ncbi:FG-GAP repeat domain-containing protein [Streptomyces sp. NPDC059070]|uniref:FG-GAP repeat domain-containing protein n=1 Tax=Streptomyces sp. NPDC059070 TaxID=3346713 RepID=UPI0036A74894
MTGSRIPRRLMALAISAGLAVTAGPLVAPIAAAMPLPAAAHSPRALVKIVPGAEVLSAGTTGFLSANADGTLRWTRYSDGVSTELGKDTDHSPTLHGTASDTVVLGDHPERPRSSDKITLRNMATGTSTVVDLATRGYRYAGTVGDTVVATKGSGDTSEVHLLAQVDGSMTDRVVTGLPTRLQDVKVTAGTAGAVLLGFKEGSYDPFTNHLVVDLASAKAVDSKVRHLSGDYAHTAVSSTHVATLSVLMSGRYETNLSTARRDGSDSWSGEMLDVGHPPLVGLVGDWVLYGNARTVDKSVLDNAWKTSFKAMPLGGGTARKVLDHATSVTPAPDGSVLVTGGTVEQGEGLYRLSASADGAPVAELVAPTGEPTKITVLGSEVPAVLDRTPWRARWRLSRLNVEVSVTVRHTASGREYVSNPSSVFSEHPGAGWVDFEWDGLFHPYDGTVAAPNGAYTWRLVAKPMNGLGPDLDVNGNFTLARPASAHDYSDNGSPDVLVRDSAGWLYREDTFHDPAAAKLDGRTRDLIGSGWNTYDKLVSVGNVAGAPNADLVARDKSGVLWLYLGKGDGNFTARTRIGGGWNTYNEMTAGSDLTGDGLGDLLARDASGTLWLYKGTGNRQAPFAGRVKLGGGWNAYHQITAVSDIAGAEAGDLVARDKDGVLWLYLGKGDGNFTARARIGGGWNTYRRLIGIGDSDNDGKADVLAYDQQGKPYVYHGTGERQDPLADRQETSLEDAPPYQSVI